MGVMRVLRLAGAWRWVVVVLGLSACVPPVHTAAGDGVIDLSGEPFSRGRVPLDGEWRGIRGAHVPVDVPMTDASLWPVPGTWPDDPGEESPELGLATYSLVIRLPEEGGPYSIRPVERIRHRRSSSTA